jgi:hypothetical protein
VTADLAGRHLGRLHFRLKSSIVYLLVIEQVLRFRIS